MYIELDHFVGIHVALIDEVEGHLDFLAGHRGLDVLVSEGHIGEAVAEGVHRLDFLGVEPAVAHIETFGVFGDGLWQRFDEGLALSRAHGEHVGAEHQREEVAAGAVRIREVAHGVGRAVFQFHRERERQLARRGDVAEEYLCERGAAFGAVPPTLDDSRGVGLENLEVGRAARNQDRDNIRVGIIEGLDKGLLAAGKFDVLAVAAFGFDVLVRTSEEDDQVGFLGQFEGVSQQFRIGRLVDGSGFQRVFLGRSGSPAAAREIFVAGRISYLDPDGSPFDDALERRDFVEGFHAGAHAAALGLELGILADDGNPFHVRLDGEDVLVLEQDDGLLGHFEGDLLALGLRSHDDVGLVVRHRVDRVAYAKDLADFLVHEVFGQRAGGDGIDHRLAQVGGACHLHVEAVQHGAHGAVGAAPVGDGHALEAPFAAENLIEQVLVLGAIVSVDLVVGGHHAHGAAFDDGALKRLEVDLAEGALIDLDVYAAAVGLLVVHGEVLDAHGCSLVLHALRVGECQGGGEDRVLAQVFVGAATHRQALDVDGRAENHILAAEAGFLAHAGSVLVGQLLAPGGGEGAAGGEVGGGVEGPAGAHEAVGLALLADAERTVRVVDVGDAEAFHAGG